MKTRIAPKILALALFLLADSPRMEQIWAAEFPLPPADHSAPPTPYKTAALVSYHDGSFVGPVTSSYYGDVQVKVTVAGGKIIAVDALQFPSDRSTSRRINARALPLLQSEVIKAQSGRINAVTGATITSEAYLKSLAKALAEAAR